MSDPRQQQDEPGELDLDPETVGDLELSDDTADDVRGGTTACLTLNCAQSNAYYVCASNACVIKR